MQGSLVKSVGTWLVCKRKKITRWKFERSGRRNTRRRRRRWLKKLGYVVRIFFGISTI